MSDGMRWNSAELEESMAFDFYGVYSHSPGEPWEEPSLSDPGFVLLRIDASLFSIGVCFFTGGVIRRGVFNVGRLWISANNPPRPLLPRPLFFLDSGFGD